MTMSTHELARVLLSAPDAPARVHVYDGNDWDAQALTAFVPDEDEAAYMDLPPDAVGQAYISAEESG